MISDTAFDASLRADAGIALAAVSYDGCALKHVAPQLRSMAIIGYGDWQSRFAPEMIINAVPVLNLTTRGSSGML